MEKKEPEEMLGPCEIKGCNKERVIYQRFCSDHQAKTDLDDFMSDGRTIRCRESVRRTPGWPSYGQCTRKAWKGDFCKQHHPDTIKAKQNAAMAKDDAKNAAFKAKEFQRLYEREALELVKKIARTITHTSANHGKLCQEFLRNRGIKYDP